MSKKRYLIGGLIYAALLMFTGCINGNEGQDVNTNAINNPVKRSEAMDIYVYSYDVKTIKAIEEFNSQSQIKISMTELKDESDARQYREKIVTSMLAGNGPDIVLDNAYWFPALWKNIKNGVFYDLNELIEKDKQFNIRDYNESVLDEGRVNSKRYFIPLEFNIPILWSTDKAIKQNDISIGKNGFTWEDFRNNALKCNNKNGVKKYFVGFDFTFSSIVRSSWAEWVDLVNKKTNFDSDEFITLLKDYKEIYPTICPNEKILNLPGIYFDLLENESLIMVNGSLEASPYQLWNQNSAVNALLDAKMEIYPYPSITAQKKINAQIGRFAAIGSYSGYKNEAFCFIKLLLSDKYQGMDVDGNSFGAPVNQYSFNKLIKILSGEEGRNKALTFKSETIKSIPLQENLIINLNKCISNTKFKIMDVNIVDMIDQEVSDFMEGKQSAEQTAKRINDRVRIYINE